MRSLAEKMKEKVDLLVIFKISKKVDHEKFAVYTLLSETFTKNTIPQKLKTIF